MYSRKKPAQSLLQPRNLAVWASPHITFSSFCKRRLLHSFSELWGQLTSCSFNSEQLLEIIDEHGLTQLVKEPTRDDNILDLVLTNNVNIINNVRVIPGISDHDMVLFEVNLACRKKKPVRRKIYMRKRADTTRIKKELQDFANDFALYHPYKERITRLCE